MTLMEQCAAAERAMAPKKPQKRRRQFEAMERHTVLYYKRRPSMSRFSYEIYTDDPPSSLKRAMKMNTIWMVCCYLMSRGWNSLGIEDSLPLQQFGYMENIELPPTRLDVVRETLVKSQNVALESGETICHSYV